MSLSRETLERALVVSKRGMLGPPQTTEESIATITVYQAFKAAQLAAFPFPTIADWVEAQLAALDAPSPSVGE